MIWIGSWAYTRTHADELDRHVMASSYDIGSGRITGFFTNGREELVEVVDQVLAPVKGLGPFHNVNAPIVGTDNYDFMMQGVANLVANQESANYGPNYHARSDTFDKVDLHQLRLNAAIAAAVTYGFAEVDVTWSRHRRRDIQRLKGDAVVEGNRKRRAPGVQLEHRRFPVVIDRFNLTHDRHDDVRRADLEDGVALAGCAQRQSAASGREPL